MHKKHTNIVFIQKYFYQFITWFIIISFNFFENLNKKIFGSKVAKITPIFVKPFSLEWDEENNIKEIYCDESNDQCIGGSFNTNKNYPFYKIKID
jgi:hypothetical protein